MNGTKGSARAISSLPNLRVYKEHVIYQPLIDCYDRAGHLLECLIPARCNPTSQTTHTARCGVVPTVTRPAKELTVPYRSVKPATGEVLKTFTEHTDQEMMDLLAIADTAFPAPPASARTEERAG